MHLQSTFWLCAEEVDFVLDDRIAPYILGGVGLAAMIAVWWWVRRGGRR